MMKKELNRPATKKAGLIIQKQVKTFDSKHVIWLAMVMIITFMVLFPVNRNEFTNWDDGGYVTQNKYVKDLTVNNIKIFFSEYFVSNYHPVTMLSLAFDYRLGGGNAWMFHITSLILHLIVIVLVFWFTYLLFSKFEIALITAALFGVHTLHVEPVAWISDRKDLLCTVFFLSSMIGYLKYTKATSVKLYIITLLFFIVSALSKATAVSLSVTLIATDYLLKRRLTDIKVIAEKIPFFLVSIAVGIIAVKAQKSSASIADSSVFAIYERILFACYGLTQYFVKLILPLNLSAIYPFPVRLNGSIPASFWFYPVPVLVVIALFIVAIKRSRMIAYLIMFFVINVFLLLQLIPVGGAIMADRYAYLPSLSYFILIGYGYNYITEKKQKLKVIPVIILCGYFVLLSGLTVKRTGDWKDSITLWNDVLSKYRHVTVAWINRGNIRFEKGDYKAAIDDYNHSIRLKDEHAEAFLNRGTSKKELGDINGAIADYDTAISLNRKFDKAWYNRGGAKLDLNDFEGAIADYNQAIVLNPDYAEAYSNRGNAKVSLANNNKNLQLVYGALADYNRAVQLKQDYVEAYSNRGIARSLLGDYDGAVNDFDITLNLNPNDALALFLRGMTKAERGRREEGCADLYRAYMLGFRQAEEQIKRLCKK
jgi:tetratricopeptide (TPR) repeat protein